MEKTNEEKAELRMILAAVAMHAIIASKSYTRIMYVPEAAFEIADAMLKKADE